MSEPSAAPPEARDEHARLAQQIDENAYRYYVLDAPTVSDALVMLALAPAVVLKL